MEQVDFGGKIQGERIRRLDTNAIKIDLRASRVTHNDGGNWCFIGVEKRNYETNISNSELKGIAVSNRLGLAREKMEARSYSWDTNKVEGLNIKDIPS